jgi:16S rRNA (guanine(966)-N(2))-methyltransferase RsmD
MFLDAYAGVGAVGIEAVSRGASGVAFVDSSPIACRSIRRNLESLGIVEDDRVGVHVGQLGEFVRKWEGPPFDIVFVDPPYSREDLYRSDIEMLGAGSVLGPGGIVIAEHGRKMELPPSAGVLQRTRVYPHGSSALTFYRWEHESERSQSH